MNQSNAAIRPNQPDEIDVLCNIEKAARIRYQSLQGFERIADYPPIEGNRFDAGETLAAHYGGDPVGFVLLQIIDEHLYIANISVRPDVSRRGIGRLLLKAAEGQAMKLGAPAITLTTFKTPPWNGPWFRSFGYKVMPGDRIGSGLSSILGRHAKFLDMSMRETLWKKLSNTGAS